MSMRIFCSAFIITITITYAFSGKSASVYRIIPKTNEQLQLLHNLSRYMEDVSYWKDPTSLNEAVDVMIPVTSYKEFELLMKKNDIIFNTQIPDVQALLDNATTPQLHARRRSSSSFGWDRFNSLEEIYSWLESLQRDYSDRVSIIVGGKSYEGRDIKGVRISSSQQRKPGVFIESGIHAREWIAPATATYLIDQLLEKREEGTSWLADNFDWYIFPSVNPDGYVYTHIDPRKPKYRLWRKTRSPNDERCWGENRCYRCNGTDANRNWGFRWGGPGSSKDSCSETFGGKRAFSEIETNTLSRYIRSISKQLFAYISFHSYIEKIMIPYGHTTAHLDNYDEQYKVGLRAENALFKRSGYKFDLGTIAEILGRIASGGSVCWVKATFKLPFVYVYELRGHSKDGQQYGFIPPPSEIKPSGEEVLVSLVALFKAAKRYYPHYQIQDVIQSNDSPFKNDKQSNNDSVKNDRRSKDSSVKDVEKSKDSSVKDEKKSKISSVQKVKSAQLRPSRKGKRKKDRKRKKKRPASDCTNIYRKHGLNTLICLVFFIKICIFQF